VAPAWVCVVLAVIPVSDEWVMSADEISVLPVPFGVIIIFPSVLVEEKVFPSSLRLSTSNRLADNVSNVSVPFIQAFTWL